MGFCLASLSTKLQRDSLCTACQVETDTVPLRKRRRQTLRHSAGPLVAWPTGADWGPRWLQLCPCSWTALTEVTAAAAEEPWALRPPDCLVWGKLIPALELNPRAENELGGVGKSGKNPHKEKTFPLFSTRTVS